jgi:hypothetical protein
MPFVTTIIARLLAIEDWYLSQFVDVELVATGSPNACWSFDIVNATLNPCGQEFSGAFTSNATGAWGTTVMGTINLMPSLLSVLIFAGPFASWTPYIPPPAPTPP